jgi:TFIIF-interacting CTD phosphatase-like protein
MSKTTSKNLFIFDLDHTLLYCSYLPSTFHHVSIGNYQYLVIRPFAEELLNFCFTQGDCYLYTSSKRSYTSKALPLLPPIFQKVYTRKHTLWKENYYQKAIHDQWLSYQKIFVIDDSLHYWQPNEMDKINWIKVEAYHGEPIDDELLKIQNTIRHNLSM